MPKTYMLMFCCVSVVYLIRLSYEHECKLDKIVVVLKTTKEILLVSYVEHSYHAVWEAHDGNSAAAPPAAPRAT